VSLTESLYQRLPTQDRDNKPSARPFNVDPSCEFLLNFFLISFVAVTEGAVYKKPKDELPEDPKVKQPKEQSKPAEEEKKKMIPVPRGLFHSTSIFVVFTMHL